MLSTSKVFTFLLLVLLTTHAYSEVKTIGILKFSSSAGVNKAHAASIEEYVHEKFNSTNRFNIVERSRLDAIETERFIQELNNVDNQSAINDIGADYIVAGNVSDTATKQEKTDTSDYYQASVTYSLRVIDVSNGRILSTKQFSNGRDGFFSNLFSGFNGDNDTPAGAVDIAIRQTEDSLINFIAQVFPVTGQIVQVERVSRRDRVEEVLVSLGQYDGITKDTELSAYITETIKVAGKNLIRKKFLAELEFVRSEGDHLSIFKVDGKRSKLTAELLNKHTVYVEVIAEED